MGGKKTWVNPVTSMDLALPAPVPMQVDHPGPVNPPPEGTHYVRKVRV